ncbi:MAG: hypothetical protein AB7F59_12670 [Bdellovibrionales bacterium]
MSLSQTKYTELDAQFNGIPIDDFISGSQVHADIYLRLSENKYLKVGHRGQRFDEVRLENYRKKGLDEVFLTKNDFAKYVGFNLELAKKSDF